MLQTQSVKLMRSLSNCSFPRIVVLATIVCCPLTAPCQEGDNGKPVPAVGVNRDVQTAQPDPFAEQQVSVARRGNRQMADAISSLARTGRWPEVNLLLERLASKKLDVATLAAMQKRIEPAVFLEMRLNDQLSDNAKLALDQLANASNEFLQSPQRLRTAISQLEDVSTDRRLAASRVLIEGENASIVELVSAAIATEPPAERTTILRALLRQGSGGVAALQQLALYGKPETRSAAIESLGLIDAQANVVDLLAALHSEQATSKEREVASHHLSRLSGRFLDRNFAVAYLVADLDRQQRLASEIDNDDRIVTFWSAGRDQATVESARTRAIYIAYRNAADAAARIRKVGAFAPSIVTKSLVADLGYRVMVDPDWGDPKQFKSVLAAYKPSLDSGGLARALTYAIEIDDEASTIGLLRLIQVEGSTVGGNEILLGMGSERSPLVVAAASPYPRVRYEAALTATRLAGGAGYPGSSQVQQVLSEMVRLEDLPTAVIVETRPEVIAPIEQVLGRLGYRSTVVHSVAQLQQCVALGGDIRMIVTKSQLADFPPIELIDVVRRTSRGSRLPIVMYGINHAAREILDPDLHGADAARWKSPTEWIEQPTTTAAYVGILDRIDRQRRLPHLSTIDRQRFRREASAIIYGSDSES